MVANLFVKKMCLKTLPSAADFDEAEDSGSNGVSDDFKCLSYESPLIKLSLIKIQINVNVGKREI